MGMTTRPRREGDLRDLLGLLRCTHKLHGYPVRETNVRADWLVHPDEIQGWVAVQSERVLGHVALHAAHGASLPLWQEATGREPDGLAVVSRLFTGQSVRGAGTALLDLAVKQSVLLGRAAVLEVERAAPAREFYLRRGWQEVGGAVQTWGHRTVDVAIMVAAA